MHTCKLGAPNFGGVIGSNSSYGGGPILGIRGDLEGSVIVSADSSVSESHSALVPVFVARPPARGVCGCGCRDV